MARLPRLTLFPTPTHAEQVARGPKNTLLFTEFGLNKIATITTSGVVIRSPEFPHSEPTGITAGTGRNVWFFGFGNNKVYTSTVPH